MPNSKFVLEVAKEGTNTLMVSFSLLSWSTNFESLRVSKTILVKRCDLSTETLYELLHSPKTNTTGILGLEVKLLLALRVWS